MTRHFKFLHIDVYGASFNVISSLLDSNQHASKGTLIVILVIITIFLLALLLLCLLKFSSCCPKDLAKHQKLTVFDSINIHDAEMSEMETTNMNESLDSLESLGGHNHNNLTRTATQATGVSGISGSRSKNMSQTSVGSSRRGGAPAAGGRRKS